MTVEKYWLWEDCIGGGSSSKETCGVDSCMRAALGSVGMAAVEAVE